MADEIASTSTPSVASTATPSAEVAVSPTPEVTVTETSPAPASTEPVPAVEPQKTETPAEAPKPETLLGSSEKPTEEKPAEAKPEEKPAEVKEGEPAPLPSYEIKLPETVQFDAERMGDFTKTLAEFENTTKASHEEVQKLGQSLVDRHIAEVNSTIERYTKGLTDAWAKQKNDWKDSFQKDPEFANRTNTVVRSALDAINVYGGSEEQRNEFHSLMEASGLGNHPAMIRLLSNIMLAKAEPKPLAAPQIAKAIPQSKVQKMYGKKLA